MKIRTPLLVISLLSALLVACSDEADPTPTPTPTPTASTTPTATATPTATPGLPMATGAIPPVVGQVVAAVTGGQPENLSTLIAYQEVGCTSALGAGGPPKCQPGDADGTVYTVFATGTCEGEWVEDAGPRIAEIVESAGPLYAAARVVPPNPDPEPYWPKGDAVVVFRAATDEATASGVYFVLGGGKVVRAHAICGAGADDDDLDALIEDLGGTEYFVAPVG